jgi:uncharacterized protein (TIGR03435 family)
MRRTSFIGVILALGCVGLSAQTPAARRKFEVASIRRNKSIPPRIYVNPYVLLPGGRFTATYATLMDLIDVAYRTRRIQIRGGPSWIDAERFDVAAKADESEGEVAKGQWEEMLQALLEDRFKLAMHRETREMTVYTLVTGKAPPKLEPAKEGEQKALLPGERGQMIFQGMPLSGLVNTLANNLHTPVVDGTGIAGAFDFTLDPVRFSDPDQPVTPNNWGELMRIAVRQQLGLEIVKRKEPLEITVVDHAEQPSDN